MILILHSLLSAFLLTVVLESVPLLFYHPRKKWLIAGLFCNFATNPILNILRILFYSLWPTNIGLLLFTLFLEILAVLVETWLYGLLADASRTQAFFTALLCNGLSFVVGFLILYP